MERGRSDSCTSIEGGKGSKKLARSPAGEEGEKLHRKLRTWKEEIVESLKEIMEEQEKRMKEEIKGVKKRNYGFQREGK